jgi:hypothetical protein
MPEVPICPVCGLRPVKRNASRRLQKTCGDPTCVRAATGSRAGQAQTKPNFRLGPGGHACGDPNSFAEGANGHYDCGGTDVETHICVQHAGYCDSWDNADRPPFDPAMHNAGPVCRDKSCIGASVPRHRHAVVAS